MPEPLDFSSVGSKKATLPAPPPRMPKRPSAGGPKRPAAGAVKRPAGSRPRKARMRAAALAGVALLVIIGIVVLSKGGGESAADRAVETIRYCELSTSFHRLLPTNDPLTAPTDMSPRAIRQILKQIGGGVEEMEDNAPAVIRADVAATVKAVQEAAEGNTAGIRSPSFPAQSLRIASFRQQNCAAGGEDQGA